MGRRAEQDGVQSLSSSVREKVMLQHPRICCLFEWDNIIYDNNNKKILKR